MGIFFQYNINKENKCLTVTSKEVGPEVNAEYMLMSAEWMAK